MPFAIIGRQFMKRIVLTGGGTAGHVTPNLALIPELKKAGWEIHYIGREEGIERELIEAVDGVTYYGIASGKLRRYFDVKNFSDPFRVIKGFGQAASIIGRLKPDVVFSKGGFVSVPVVYAAAMHHVPVVSHESDMTPGLANKLTTPFVKALCCTFPEAAKLAGDKGVYTGSPIRPEILSGSREAGLKRFGFTESHPVLMVTGGSSGAQSINKALREALPKLTGVFQVLHLCGKGNLDPMLDGTKNYVQVEYLTDEMPDAFACSDILISRAGSNTVCEIVALKKPSLLIPYPKTASRGDQILNAESLKKRGLAEVLLQENMTADELVKQIISLYHDRGKMIDALEAEPSGDGLKNVLAIIEKNAKK